MKWAWVLVLVVLSPRPLHATELSLVKGLFGSNKVEDKLTGSEQGSAYRVSLGARLGIASIGEWTHLVGADFRHTSFTGSDGFDPDNMVSGSVSYGIRRMFPLGSPTFVPFAAGEAAFKSEKDGEFLTAGFREVETIGLFYAVQVGLRTNLNESFFVDFWAVMFESALFASSTSTIYSMDGSVVEKDETTRMELLADSASPLSEVVLGFGFLF
jgi:hypothetical protein